MPNGKICYLEIPATEVQASADFYSKIFGWNIRTRGDGALAFDDTTGAVSGSWVPGRPPSRDAGILTYVMVDSIDQTLEQITKSGGHAVTPRTLIGPGPDAWATFRDPAGNLVGLYQGR